MKILNKFVEEFKKYNTSKISIAEDGLVGDIKNINEKLLDDYFLPSVQLKSILKKQIRKARYPMEIAIIGQFSSGKSTFLNALLSKDILPTGITPVTSKVNFISYGSEYKLKISYYSGAYEYAPIEEISKFTDQREADLKNIKYLTLYAPLDILKNISFVDTPGLNSQSHEDTKTTTTILRDVGGIIWLSLIHNAGKQSELEILEKYMNKFKNKSLCVLNQKDKFNNEQILTTKKYIENKFGNYFSKIIPISAKMALESRTKQKDILINQEKEILIKGLSKNKNEKDFTNILNNSIIKFQDKIKNINNLDTSLNTKKLEESNIQEILSYIQNVLRPQAKLAKEFSIKNDLKNICQILIQEYETILEVYNSLKNILINNNDDIINKFDNLNTNHSLSLNDIYINFENIIDDISNIIYNNIKDYEESMYIKNNNLLQKNKYKKITFNANYIDINTINNKLLSKDEQIYLQIKTNIKKTNLLKNSIENNYKDIFNDIKNKITQWQKLYELIKKHREISSDLEFSLTRHFAAKVYENITRYYNISILNSISKINVDLSSYNSEILNSYSQNIQTTIFTIKEKMLESIELHKQNQNKFFVYKPSKDEILDILKLNFNVNEKELFLISRSNFLYKIIKSSKKEYNIINKERIEFINKKQIIYTEKINKLKQIKKEIYINR